MFEVHFSVKSGDSCAVCITGTLSLRKRVPMFGKPGKSRCSFQCGAWGSMQTEIQDDRFIACGSECAIEVGEGSPPGQV